MPDGYQPGGGASPRRNALPFSDVPISESLVSVLPISKSPVSVLLVSQSLVSEDPKCTRISQSWARRAQLAH